MGMLKSFLPSFIKTTKPAPDKKPAEKEDSFKSSFDFYFIDDKSMKITGYKSKAPTVVIPKSYAGRDIVEIADDCFSCNTQIVKVDFSRTVIKRIGDRAFIGCSALKNVIPCEGLEYIGKNAFDACESLTGFDETVVRGESGRMVLSRVYYVGDRAFKNCSALTEVSISSAIQYVGTEAFSGCTSLETALFWRSTLVEADTCTIMNRAFSGCSSLVTVTMPQHATQDTLKGGIFEGCTSLKAIRVSRKGDLHKFFKATKYSKQVERVRPEKL